MGMFDDLMRYLQPSAPHGPPTRQGQAPVQLGGIQSMLSRPGMAQGLLGAAGQLMEPGPNFGAAAQAFTQGLSTGQERHRQSQRDRIEQARMELEAEKARREQEALAQQQQYLQGLAAQGNEAAVAMLAGVTPQQHGMLYDQQRWEAQQMLREREFEAERAYRQSMLGETARHHRASEANARMSAGGEAASSPGRVMGPIFQKIAAGVPLSEGERLAMDEYKSIDPVERIMRQQLGGAGGGGMLAGAPPPAAAASPAPVPPPPAPAPPVPMASPYTTPPSGAKEFLTRTGKPVSMDEIERAATIRGMPVEQMIRELGIRPAQ